MNQPPPGYPPYQMPPGAFYPPPRPQKKHTAWWIILGIGIGIISCVGCALLLSLSNTRTSTATTTTTSNSYSDNDTSSGAGSSTHVVFAHSTPAPTMSTPWKTTHTFQGNGTKKTELFPISDDWKLSWTCNPASFDGMQYNVIVTVYGSDNTMQDVAINTLCKYGNASGSTEEHSGGSIYLDVDSEGSWNLTIQEPN
jgi:hypothetical protein